MKESSINQPLEEKISYSQKIMKSKDNGAIMIPDSLSIERKNPFKKSTYFKKQQLIE